MPSHCGGGVIGDVFPPETPMGDWVRRSAVTLTKGSSNTLFAVREPSSDVVVHPRTLGPRKEVVGCVFPTYIS